MVCWFLLAKSNTNSASLLLLLSAILSYYLSSLYKHLFYFQARVEQPVPFHHLTSFSSYYDARVKTSRTDSVAIHKLMWPAGYPKNTCPACTPGTSRTNPSLSYHGFQVPIQTWTLSPHSWVPDSVRCKDLHHLHLQSVGPERAKAHNKRATSLPCAHTQVCARDNRSVTGLASVATTGP